MQLITAKKLITTLAIAAIVLAIVIFIASLMPLGTVSIKNALTGIYDKSQINPDYEIFFRIRLPRIILAALIGAALAASGTVFQALLRNPLADPYILGISSGAGLGAVTAMVCGLTWTFMGHTPVAFFAFAGAMVTVSLVWFVGSLTSKAHITGLLLAGVVINAFFSALIMFLTSIAKSDRVYSTIFWLMGNITEQDYFLLFISAGFIITCIVALFYISPQLNVLTFGEHDAKTMGVNPAQIRTSAFILASLMTAIAVSLSGLVGFVGLVTPHAIRLVFGPDHRQLLPLSAVTGAIFLIIADTVARIIVAPAQLPVGVITAIVGGPVFLILLIKYTRQLGRLSK